MNNLIGSFQTSVNTNNPIGVEGDFASTNPRASAVNPGFDSSGNMISGFIAGSNGVTIGQFAWISSDGRTVTNQGAIPEAA